MDDLVRSLREFVGAEHVLVDADLRSGYEVDWTRRYRGTADAIIRPGTTDEVAAVLEACNGAGVAIVAQGGNTGLVGGGVPRTDPSGRPVIVLSLRRLASVGDLDTAAMQLSAGAGATIAEWRDAARSVGLDSPIDFAARDSATIGGAIATNAGGSRVLRFGTMRQQVVGIEAVLATGDRVGSMSGLTKETVGLHWPSLLAGSEGTLGVVTAARLRLVPGFAHVATALASIATVDGAVELAATLRGELGSLDALEIIQPEAMRLVAAHLETPCPVDLSDHGTVLLVECADHTDPAPALTDVLDAASGVLGSAIALDDRRRDGLTRFRDRITEAINAADGAPPFKLDVAVPLRSLRRLLEVADRAATTDGARLIPFGHLAEGNLHLNYLGATRPEQIADTVLGSVSEMGGTISAEHGVGVAKTPWLHLVRSPADLAAQRSLRLALDPNRTLNPGVLDPGDQVP